MERSRRILTTHGGVTAETRGRASPGGSPRKSTLIELLVACRPKLHRSVRRPVRAAFTLIELLVVISIIAILAAMLMPALSKAREKSREVACKNRVKQIALSVLIYADSNKECLIPAAVTYGYGPAEWYRKLDKYLGLAYGGGTYNTNNKGHETIVCPTLPLTTHPYNLGYGWNYQEFGYHDQAHPGYPGWSQSYDYGYGTRLSRVKYPSENIMFGDSEDRDARNPQPYYANRFLYRRHSTLTPRRHSDGGNMAMVDGHVERLGAAELRRSPGSAPYAPWRGRPSYYGPNW